jgi:hypothetical protein
VADTRDRDVSAAGDYEHEGLTWYGKARPFYGGYMLLFGVAYLSYPILR